MKFIPTLIVALLISNVAFAQEKKPNQKKGSEIKKFINAYVSAFNQEDAEKVQACFHFPHSTLNQEQDFTVVSDASELELESFWNLIKTDFNWKSNKVKKIQVLASTEDTAMVGLTMEGMNGDGKAFTIAKGFLGLSKQGGKWGFSQVSWYFTPVE